MSTVIPTFLDGAIVHCSMYSNCKHDQFWKRPNISRYKSVFLALFSIRISVEIGTMTKLEKHVLLKRNKVVNRVHIESQLSRFRVFEGLSGMFSKVYWPHYLGFKVIIFEDILGTFDNEFTARKIMQLN